MLRSVANLTRADAREFLALAPNIPVKTSVTPMPLDAANEALAALAPGRIDRRRGAGAVADPSYRRKPVSRARVCETDCSRIPASAGMTERKKS